ncbi:MAG: hypothetical protein SNJ85_05105 [Cyanobacteriota bacterium]
MNSTMDKAAVEAVLQQLAREHSGLKPLLKRAQHFLQQQISNHPVYIRHPDAQEWMRVAPGELPP